MPIRASLTLTTLILSSLLAALAARPAPALERRDEAVPTDNPFTWLAGHWTGEGFGGEVEETWSAPHGGVMLGTFQLVSNGRPSFYELFTLSQEDGEWTMRLRHFDPDLSAWEDKKTPLVWQGAEIEADSARFGPVSYERAGEDTLRISVEVDQGEGARVEELVLKRTRS